MTITCTGNGDQSVKQIDNQSMDYLPWSLSHPKYFVLITAEYDLHQWDSTARLNYSHCHKANMMLRLNSTNIDNLSDNTPEALNNSAAVLACSKRHTLCSTLCGRNICRPPPISWLHHAAPEKWRGKFSLVISGLVSHFLHVLYM